MRLEDRMSAKVDQMSVAEPNSIKMSGTSTSSGVSSGGPKVSKFTAKSGFVIPKNKLSGSLVPIFRGGKRPGGNDVNKEESSSQVQRKTKWGPDLTQDTAVRRGRAIAYQTRVDQIAEQLKTGIQEAGENQDSQVADEPADSEPSSPQIGDKSSDLEHERREAIAEILKLNPSYKAPPDYKPLLKEAKVPIPIKENPGFNFVGLIFGPRSETLQRMEKETGAKIQLYGIKANTREKAEISPTDGNETQVAYEELVVHVSAETFEKVDAAVALLELLVTSVPENLGADKKANVSQENSAPFMVANQKLVQPVVGPTQTSQQGQFQYQSMWFQTAVPQAPMHPISNFSPPLTYSAPIFSNPVHVQSSPLNPSTMPSLFGPRPVPVSGFNSILQNPSPVPIRPEPSLQVFPNTYLPRNFPMPASQPSSVQANIPVSLPFTGSQPPPTQLYPIARPLISSLPLPVSTVLPGPQINGPLNSAGGSMGWSGPALGPVNMGQTNPMVPPPGPRPPQPGFPSSAPPSNMTAGNVVSPATFSSGLPSLHLSSLPSNHPTAAVSSASIPPPQGGPSILRPVLSSAQLMDITSLPNLSRNPFLGSTPISSPMTPASQPTVTTPKPLHSGPGDFAFRPPYLQNSAPQTFPRLTSQHAIQNTPLPNSMVPESPAFHLIMPHSSPQLGMHTFPRPQVGNQIHQTQPYMSAAPFAGNQTGVSVPPRLSSFSNTSPGATPSVLSMGLRNFSSAPQLPNLGGPFNPRPGNSMQLQQHYATPVTPLGNLMAVNHLNRNTSFSGKPVSSSGGQQIYDPFSPTSVSIAYQRQAGNPAKGRQHENDPEYDDLMASVGVK